MNLIPAVNVSADALNAEKIRMSIVAQNIANAHTTRDSSGKVYQRKIVSFESILNPKNASGGIAELARTVRIREISNDLTPGKKIYNPQHPDADADGMVQMPNVEISREMVDLITSSRAYEANLSVIRTARQMAQQALLIGR